MNATGESARSSGLLAEPFTVPFIDQWMSRHFPWKVLLLTGYLYTVQSFGETSKFVSWPRASPKLSWESRYISNMKVSKWDIQSWKLQVVFRTLHSVKEWTQHNQSLWLCNAVNYRPKVSESTFPLILARRVSARLLLHSRTLIEPAVFKKPVMPTIITTKTSCVTCEKK
jgi:hypothetical protein